MIMKNDNVGRVDNLLAKARGAGEASPDAWEACAALKDSTIASPCMVVVGQVVRLREELVPWLRSEPAGREQGHLFRAPRMSDEGK